MDFSTRKVSCKYLDSCYMVKSMKCSLFKHSSSDWCALLSSESHIVVYAQIGGTATLSRDVWGNKDNVYVNWYRGSDQIPTISRNPQSGNLKGEMHTVLRQHNNQATVLDITAHVCLSFVGKDMNTRASLLSDFSLQISPVQDFDFEVWRCEQHELTSKSSKTYRLYPGKTEKVKKDPNFTVSKSLKAIFHSKNASLCHSFFCATQKKNCFCPYNENQWVQKQHWTPLSFILGQKKKPSQINKSSFAFHRSQKSLNIEKNFHSE